MKQEKFEQLISQVAQWHRPHCDENDAALRYRINRERRQMTQQGWSAEQIEQHLSQYRNESLPRQLVSVVIQPQHCGDCGQHCPQGRQQDHRLVRHSKSGLARWCSRCHNCQRQNNPWTGEYNLSNRYAGTEWGRWSRSASPTARPPQRPRLPKPAQLNLNDHAAEDED